MFASASCEKMGPSSSKAWGESSRDMKVLQYCSTNKKSLDDDKLVKKSGKYKYI